MPELPEVETTRRGLALHLVGQRIARAIVRNPGLRWEIAPGLSRRLEGQSIRALSRRGKYLLIECTAGCLILHLGMSGSLRLLPAATPAERHDHFDLVLENGWCMRLRDPRRFGAVLWTAGEPLHHPLLAGLGVEPLTRAFNARWLYQHTRGRTAAIKQVLMDGRGVAGIGNIYANEALFRAGIHPRTAAGDLGLARLAKLVQAVKTTLRLAIRAGGSSLRDFVGTTGEPGRFQQRYRVYGRTGQPCRRCGTPVRQLRLGQRATFYCPHCQT